jgi:hypothetical protein
VRASCLLLAVRAQVGEVVLLLARRSCAAAGGGLSSADRRADVAEVDAGEPQEAVAPGSR